MISPSNTTLYFHPTASRNNWRVRYPIFEFGYGIVLFITCTQLYRFPALWLGMQVTTAALAALGLCYLALHKLRLQIGVRRVLLVVTVFLGLPIFSLLFVHDFPGRELGLQLHYVILLFSSVIFFSYNRKGEKIFIPAFILAAIALVVELAVPGIYDALKVQGAAQVYYGGRGGGLYLQPNSFSYNLAFLLLGVVVSLDGNRTKAMWCCIIVYGLSMIFTASRGGLLVGLLIIFCLYALANPKLGVARLISQSMLALFVLMTIVILSYYGAKTLTSLLGIVQFETLIDRLAEPLRQTIANLGTMEERANFQKLYIERILEKPIFGYGIGSIDVLRSQMLLSGAAHNQYLQYLFHYGLVGVVLMSIFLRTLWHDLRQLSSSSNYNFNVLIFVSLCLICFGTNSVLQSQNFYILMGLLLARSCQARVECSMLQQRIR